MQVIVILGIALTLGLMQAAGSIPAGPWLIPLLGLYLAGTALLRAWDTSLGLNMLRAKNQPSKARFGLAAVVSGIAKAWLVLGSAATVGLGLGDVLDRAGGPMTWPLVDKLLALSPLIAALLIYWLLEYPLHRAVRLKLSQRETRAGRNPGRIWSLGQYLVFNIRHQLLFILVPVSLILLTTDLLEAHLLPALGFTGHAASLTVAATLAAALLVFLLIPVLLVRIWKTAPLPPGPTRQQLEDMCSQMQLRYRRLLVWKSEGVLANAGVMGLIAPVRYILMSDGLLENMAPEQIRAIFAHEAGHVKHHHILHAMVFAISTVMLADVLSVHLMDRWNWPVWLAAAAAMVTLLVVWAVGFGWLSRRFERQADVIAAWSGGPGLDQRPDPDRITAEGSAAFASALEEVARLNYIQRDRFNWRHGPIGWRVAHVLHLGATGGTRTGIDRLVRWIQLGLWLLLGLAVGLTAITYAGL